VVSSVSGRGSEKERDPAKIKRSLDDVVHRLDQEPDSSESWGETLSQNPEEWEALKSKIKERQRALKALVRERRAGTIGTEEFDEKYRTLQDELTELEFQVYNMRLGTKLHV
jgi:chromosome segregation ATPase